MCNGKTRSPRPDPWALITWLLVLAVLVIVLTADTIAPEPERITNQYTFEEEK